MDLMQNIEKKKALERQHDDTNYKIGLVNGVSRLKSSSPSTRPILGGTAGSNGYHKPSLSADVSYIYLELFCGTQCQVLILVFFDTQEMYDVLARRSEEDEAFCAVCGDGFSAEPNMIIFCDRCDVAVHQKCYDVVDVPKHEWLCWPCQEFEDQELAVGKAQEDIRPRHMLPEQRRHLAGGSKEVKCFLCPIKLGAFRKSTDCTVWVHQTCALWHPETFLSNESGPNVVEGLWDIPEHRFSQCSICGKTDGAVISCQYPSCPQEFHVLCARNCGFYMRTFHIILYQILSSSSKYRFHFKLTMFV